ncbi:MAG: Trm112 family protein [Burkholderia sp.]|nr:Trm112 family protein [Burkholderia sp.]
MQENLLKILVCPICKGPLNYNRTMQKLICNTDKLSYPIRDGIPVMLVDEASQILESDLIN